MWAKSIFCLGSHLFMANKDHKVPERCIPSMVWFDTVLKESTVNCMHIRVSVILSRCWHSCYNVPSTITRYITSNNPQHLLGSYTDGSFHNQMATDLVQSYCNVAWWALITLPSRVGIHVQIHLIYSNCQLWHQYFVIKGIYSLAQSQDISVKTAKHWFNLIRAYCESGRGQRVDTMEALNTADVNRKWLWLVIQEWHLPATRTVH